MKNGQRITLCHLAALKDNIIPLDPRLHLRTVSENELAISIGSLAFMRPFRRSTSFLLPDEAHKAADREDCRTEVGSDEGATDSGKVSRNSTILVKCSLYQDKTQVADTVFIRIHHNRIKYGSYASYGNNAETRSRLKHRNTYCRLFSMTHPLGTRRSSCRLLRGNDKNWRFRIKKKVQYNSKTQKACQDSDVPSWNSAMAKMVKWFTQTACSSNTSEVDMSHRRLFRKSCNRCFRKFPYDSDRLKIPTIIKINLILRFQLWKNIRNSEARLCMKTELHVDDAYVAQSELDVTPSSYSFNCFVGMLYNRKPDISTAKSVCDIRLCCCDPSKRMICSSHLLRMLDEVRRLVYLLFLYNSSYPVEQVGKYTYLLYFYLQMIALSTSDRLGKCGGTLPFAILTVGAVEFYEYNSSHVETTNEHDTDYIIKRSTWGPYYSYRRRLTKTEVIPPDPSFLDNNTEPTIALHFQQAVKFHIMQSCKGKMASLYLGPTFKEFTRTLLKNPHIPFMNFPVYGLPTKLSFLAGSDFYQDGHLVCRNFLDGLTLHSRMHMFDSGINFLPDSLEVSFIKSLMSTPLYSVGVSSNILTVMEITTSFGQIGYDKINRLLWKHLPLLSGSGECLTTFLRFVQWSSEKEASEALIAMKEWGKSDLITIIELLSIDFSPPRVPEAVQQYACQLLLDTYTVEELMPFFAQIVASAGARHLLDSLVELSSHSYKAAIHLYWALEAWGKNKFDSSRALENLSTAVDKSGNKSHVMESIKAQRALRQRLNILMRHIRYNSYGNAAGRSLRLLEFLRSENKLEVFHGLRARMDSCDSEKIIFGLSVPLYTNPSLFIYSVDTASCKILRTTRYPLLLTVQLTPEDTRNNEAHTQMTDTAEQHREFHTMKRNSTHLVNKQIMFKDGDDLRLDQICQQIAKLVDEILGSHGIESYIKHYGVLPTSHKDGFVEFLEDTKSLSAIINEEGSIEAYLIDEAMSPIDSLTKRINFAGSLASYSAITHLLGVGDRHNDNVIICKSGHLVHVDYGYILGSEPKLLPSPPFKLSEEMLAFLGGHGSHLYHAFKERFYLVFSILRRHAKLIITLVYLLADCDLYNVTLSSVVEMESRFRLSVHDDALLKQHVDDLVESSVAAYSTQVNDKWHKFAIWWK